MKLCLNMIVKNEEKRITRAFASAAPFISCYVITDTGSTDNTIQVIKEFFNGLDIPGRVTRAPFKDWSQARNAALIAARATLPRFHWDYALLMDADMELAVSDREKFYASLAGGPSYDMEQRAGTLHYQNRRLISAKATGLYRGVTHEYLDVHSAGSIPTSAAYFVDHADGANRPDKYKRDIALLLGGLEKEPENERYFYYLAQSYRDAGQHEEAAKWFKRRVDAGGWPEEQWSAQVNYAHCLKEMGDRPAFINEMLKAYNMRPSRAESLYDIARYFRDQEGMQPLGALFAEAGMAIPRTNDALFVNNFVYEAGLKEEFSITGFYVPHRREKAFAITDELSQASGPYGHVRECARQNLYHYMPKLGDLCPSFEFRNIPFTPPADWTPLNPSVAVHNGALRCIVRTVNYRIDERGAYLIKATDGTANRENPINTRNFLLDMGSDPLAETIPPAEELLPPGNLPCEFPLVIGFEDMRLFSWRGGLWTSSTVRQIHPDGNCEQVLAALELVCLPEPHVAITNVKRMLREPRETEKNWSPIVDGNELSFMHRPGVVVGTDGKTVVSKPPGYNTDNISGSSQLVPFHGGWLALVHSARPLPGESYKRYYYHRFIRYRPDFSVECMSRPFVFHDRQIEFAAGMCQHPTSPGKLVFSYGVRDCEARIATITDTEAARLLWQSR